MESIVPYVIWASLIMTGLSLVAVILFGIRGLSYGKADPTTISLLAVPAVILIVLSFVMDTWAEAAVLACVITLILTALALLASSARGLIGL